MKEKKEPPKARMSEKGHRLVKTLGAMTGKTQCQIIEEVFIEEFKRRNIPLPE